MNADETYPVRLEGERQPDLSRWLWLVKWLLAIPHYIVLVFLWLTLIVLTVVAFFAILFTGRYPRGIFEFNVGVLRWTWRVAFYSYAALGTDRYPPFTLDEAPDYPARLDVAHAEQLSRGLVLVKWLLAIPHYLVIGLFLGGGSYAASKVDDRVWHLGFEIGLIGVLVIFAGVALLFSRRYPPGIYDFVLGLDRWVARVAAYVLLMRDEYPPFRLDKGGTEGATFVIEAPVEPEAPLPPPEPTEPTAAAAPRGGTTAGKVILIVVGTIAGTSSLSPCSSAAARSSRSTKTQRDDDGFLMSPTEELSTPTYAIVSERADLDTEGAEWALETFLGIVRIRSESTRPVFVGIGPAADVERYLDAVEHDVVTDFIHRDPDYGRRDGARRPAPPGVQRFWVASAAGSGEQTLEWDPKDGDWRAVVFMEPERDARVRRPM